MMMVVVVRPTLHVKSHARMLLLVGEGQRLRKKIACRPESSMHKVNLNKSTQSRFVRPLCPKRIEFFVQKDWPCTDRLTRSWLSLPLPHSIKVKGGEKKIKKLGTPWYPHLWKPLEREREHRSIHLSFKKCSHAAERRCRPGAVATRWGRPLTAGHVFLFRSG